MDDFIKKLEIPRKLHPSELDFYSEGIEINYNGKSRSKTCFGAFITLILVFCMGYLFSYYLIDAIDTENPRVQFDIVTEPDAANYSISNSDMKFFFLITDPDIDLLEYQGKYDLNGKIIPRRRLLQDEILGRTSRTLQNSTDTTSVQKSDPGMFLTHASYKKWFTLTAEYHILETVTDSTGKTNLHQVRYPVDVVPCDQASWMKDEAMQRFLDKNTFATETVKASGFCLNVNSTHEMFGDWLSSHDSYISVEISICDQATQADCDLNAFDEFTKPEGDSILFGSFSSSVNNSNKYDPFVYDFQSHGEISLSNLVKNHVDLHYKKLSVSTDHGIFFEDLVSKEIGVIGESRSIAYPTLLYNKATATFSMNHSPTLAVLRLTGSSRSDMYKRSYSTAFDFLGNFGGAMELVFLTLCIISVYTQQNLVDRELRDIVTKQLNIDELDKKSVSGDIKPKAMCCKRKQASVDEYSGEIVEKALSFEQLTRSTLVNNILVSSLIPQEILLLAPLVEALKNAKAREIEKLESAQKSNKVGLVENLTIKSLEEMKMKDPKCIKKDVKSQKNNKENKAISIIEAIGNLKSSKFEDKHPSFLNLKEEYSEFLNQIEGLINCQASKEAIQIIESSPNDIRSALAEQKGAKSSILEGPNSMNYNGLNSGRIKKVELQGQPDSRISQSDL